MPEPTLTCKGLLHKLFYTPDYRAQFQDAMQEKQTKKRIEKLRNLQEELGRGRYFDKMTTEMIRAKGRESLGIKGFSAGQRESREVAA